MRHYKVLAAIIFALMTPQFPVEAKCFPTKIEKLLKWRYFWVTVQKHSRMKSNRCEATIGIISVAGGPQGKTETTSTDTVLDGWSQDKEICKGKIGAEMGITMSTSCCDEPPCPKGRKNEIQFSFIRMEHAQFLTTVNCAGTQSPKRSAPGLSAEGAFFCFSS
jgi:hypothetical protein